MAAAVSNPGAVVERVKQQAATLARGAEVLRSDPAKAATILNDTPRAVGRVLGEAAATAAMAKLDTGGTGCSFDADTPVATLNGQRAIGALEVGDTVLAFNEATGMLEADPITHVWVNHDPAIEQLTLSGETLDTTPEHPFFTSERGWVVAVSACGDPLTDPATPFGLACATLLAYKAPRFGLPGGMCHPHGHCTSTSCGVVWRGATPASGGARGGAQPRSQSYPASWKAGARFAVRPPRSA